jgi:hyperosmotically inducible periplasmic protein
MSIRIVLNRSTVAFLLASLTLIQAGLAVKDDKNRHQAFIRGDIDETRLVREVRHQLAMLPYYGVFDDLSFRVDPDGTVTLMGAVTRPTLKSDAENVVKHIEGVTKVVNQIEVLPLSSEDDRIRMAEHRAIYGDPSLATRYGYRAIPPVHIIVKNGHVTLDGVVANQGDKDLINVRANSVPGVFSVTNNLRVEPS